MRKLWGSKYENDWAVRHLAVKNSFWTSQKKEIKEGVAISAFRSILFLLFYRRCGSVNVKLVYTSAWNWIAFTVFKTAKYLFRICIVKSQQGNEKKSIKPTDLILFVFPGGTHVRTCVYGRYAPAELVRFASESRCLLFSEALQQVLNLNY